MRKAARTGVGRVEVTNRAQIRLRAVMSALDGRLDLVVVENPITEGIDGLTQVPRENAIDHSGSHSDHASPLVRR